MRLRQRGINLFVDPTERVEPGVTHRQSAQTWALTAAPQSFRRKVQLETTSSAPKEGFPGEKLEAGPRARSYIALVTEDTACTAFRMTSKPGSPRQSRGCILAPGSISQQWKQWPKPSCSVVPASTTRDNPGRAEEWGCGRKGSCRA